jgi:hypothetical protein
MADDIEARLNALQEEVRTGFRTITARLEQIATIVSNISASSVAARNVAAREFRSTNDRITQFQTEADNEIGRIDANVSALAAIIQSWRFESQQLAGDLPRIISGAMAPIISGLQTNLAAIQKSVDELHEELSDKT